jgi:putative ABC transport system permease protein
MVEGRDQPAASVDQPKLTGGSWIRSGGVVVERSFADALGVHPGNSITLNGRAFRVSGIAVTAAASPYPLLCKNGCDVYTPQLQPTNPGLIWLTRADARGLATRAEMLAYFLNLKLADPASAAAFVHAHSRRAPPHAQKHSSRLPRSLNNLTAPVLNPWQEISQQNLKLATTGQTILLIGSWLLGLLAAATVAVVVGGRMAEQTRRVGLLKAVGGTPSLIAAVLLAEYMTLALLAAVAGLVTGSFAAPLLTSPGAGLVGSTGAPPLTAATVGLVIALALAVAVVATFIPALRAARTSTLNALADAAHSPERHARLTALSTRLPVPLMLGLRIAARRPRRTTLSAASIAITVTTIVTVLMVHAHTIQKAGGAGLSNPRIDRQNAVILALTLVLSILAAVNVIFITWATALDTRRSSTLARALGATPGQIAAGLSVAQVLPTLPATIIGIPTGIELYAAIKQGTTLDVPSPSALLIVVLGTLLVVAALTAIPARIGARHPVADTLQSELA